jgi:serine/threonine-protein kinase
MTGRGGKPDACPSRETLERYAVRTEGPADDATLIAHLDACPRCAGALAEIATENEILAAFVEANADRLRVEAPLAAGAAAPEGYELLGEVHRGGQGVVYRARQTATKRIVALKVLLQGTFATERQRRRFEREVELVASLKHPGIVTVFDSGIGEDGRPYLAMELIDGVPLDRHARTRQASPTRKAGVARDLELLAAICDAVGAAHRRGIIHRDLKPANVLVDGAGRPHVVVFGLAKIVGPESGAPDAAATVAGEFVGTFAYAAPEQVSGDPALVDTRTDVYALGVIAYELLTGRRPYELAGSVKDVVDAIIGAEPKRPRDVRPDLDRDVETILVRALAKSPDDRYPSIESLRDELRRFLRGEPILARSDEAMYVLRKTIRRYRVPLLGAASLVVLLGVFGVVMWRQYAIATGARNDMARTLGHSLQQFAFLDLENPEVPAPAVSIPALLDRTAATVGQYLGDAPEIAAAVRTSLGLAFMSQYRFEEAEAQLAAALDARRALHGGPHEDVAESLHNLGRLEWKLGRFDRADAFYREALAMRIEVHGPEHEDVARTMQHLASNHRSRGALAESEALNREALAMREKLLGPRHRDVAISLNALGATLRDLGRSAEAVACYRRALAVVVASEPAAGWQEARARNSLGSGLLDVGELDEAGRQLDRALELKRRVRGESDPEIAATLHQQARLELARGNRAAAESLARRAHAIRVDRLPPGHPSIVESEELIAECGE